jgi:hypothetical protein
MRVLFIGVCDWANIANRVARGMNACVGAQIARVYTEKPHSFGYLEDRMSWPELRVAAMTADWILAAGDGAYGPFYTICKRLTFKPDVRFATVHVGTAYRENYKTFNAIDTFFARRFIGGDLYRFAAGDKNAVPFCASAECWAEQYIPIVAELPVRACHATSSRSVKGTTLIETLPGVEILEGLSFDECMRRRGGSHIYIDQINDLGGFGAAAVEAMAAGCAVLGSQRNIESSVDAFYPRPPIVEVTATTIGAELEALRADRERLNDLRQRSWEWARDVARPASVGAYWLKHLGSAL